MNDFLRPRDSFPLPSNSDKPHPLQKTDITVKPFTNCSVYGNRRDIISVSGIVFTASKNAPPMHDIGSGRQIELYITLCDQPSPQRPPTAAGQAERAAAISARSIPPDHIRHPHRVITSHLSRHSELRG